MYSELLAPPPPPPPPQAVVLKEGVGGLTGEESSEKGELSTYFGRIRKLR